MERGVVEAGVVEAGVGETGVRMVVVEGEDWGEENRWSKGKSRGGNRR